MAHHGSESGSLRQLLDEQQRGMLLDLAGGKADRAAALEQQLRDRTTDAEFVKAARDPNAFEKAGATGRFPEGKLTDEDQGEIAVAIGTHEGRVVLHFGDKPVTWFALTAAQAEGFALELIQRANKLREGGR